MVSSRDKAPDFSLGADHPINAAFVILLRLWDPEITRYMGYREVKKIIEARTARYRDAISSGGTYWERQFGVGRTAVVEFPARQSLASSRYLALEQKP